MTNTNVERGPGREGPTNDWTVTFFLEFSCLAAADTGPRRRFGAALRGNNVLSELTLLRGRGAAGRSASGVGRRVVDIGRPLHAHPTG